MITLYEDYALPRKYHAIRRIREQPFFECGMREQKRLAIWWCASHRYWMVGTLNEVLEQDHLFHRQYVAFLKDNGFYESWRVGC